jgi:spermidine/putrescine transport system permease protein
VIAFLYLPVLILIINSFNEAQYGGVFTGFSFKWYQKLFLEKEMWSALSTSLIIGISATIASTILGTMAAFALYKYKSKFQLAHYGLIYTPLIIPDILMGVGLLLFFISLHIKLGLLSVFIAHTTFCLSYVTMVVLARLQNFDYSIVEAAEDLGASRFQVVRRILIPLLLPAIAAGALLSFTLSIDDFVITFFVAGRGAVTLPIYIYSMIKFGSTPVINALSFIMLALTFIVIAITERLLRDKSTKGTT